MSDAADRSQMMLAETVERDVVLNHHFIEAICLINDAMMILWFSVVVDIAQLQARFAE